MVRRMNYNQTLPIYDVRGSNEDEPDLKLNKGNA